MKRFIFRFPIVTKKDRSTGLLLLDAARSNLLFADGFCKRSDGTYTEQGVALIQNSCDLMNKSAKRLGFRNAADMDEYYRRYGKL